MRALSRAMHDVPRDVSLPHDLQDDGGHRCRCDPPWFWLASTERDEKGNASAELHLIQAVSRDLRIQTVDRRSL